MGVVLMIRDFPTSDENGRARILEAMRRPDSRNASCLCDKQKTSDDDYGTPGKFEIKSIGNGLHGIKSLDWGAFCHDKGGKAECAYPGTLNPHAKWRFIHVNDTANYFDSCPSDSA